MTDGILIADANHSTRMEQGSRELFLAIRGREEGRAALLWRDKQSGNQWGAIEGSQTFRDQTKRAEMHRQRRLAADKLRIAPRDPCPKCAVRGDIGCKHRRRA